MEPGLDHDLRVEYEEEEEEEGFGGKGKATPDWYEASAGP